MHPPDIPHLAGRDLALRSLDFSPTEAAWLTLVCLHSGVFTRHQFCRFHNCRENAAHRFVRRLVDSGIAREHPLPESRHRFTRVYGRDLYRALAIQPSRHRRSTTPAVLFRRLLSLDYVLEHADLPWLATEREKVACFTRRGIEAGRLPQRLYGGAVQTHRYFPLKLPIACGDQSATFVYADPGRETQRELGNWANVHRELWSHLRETGNAIHVAVVTRSAAAQRDYARRLDNWLGRQAGGAPSSTEQINVPASIGAVLPNRDGRGLARRGGLNADSRIAVQLQERAHQADGPKALIDSYSTHHSRHLAPSGRSGRPPSLVRQTGRR